VPYSDITVILNSACRNKFFNLHHNNLHYNIYWSQPGFSVDLNHLLSSEKPFSPMIHKHPPV
jgi:hypothetical protein